MRKMAKSELDRIDKDIGAESSQAKESLLELQQAKKDAHRICD